MMYEYMETGYDEQLTYYTFLIIFLKFDKQVTYYTFLLISLVFFMKNLLSMLIYISIFIVLYTQHI